jgi:Zn-dependent peptidase ImmA (M78 family)/transcriptional regulator with XRE-family HTH domain
MRGRSAEAEVEPAILTWARSTAGLSIEEAAHSLQTNPERVIEWEEGERHPSMAQLRKMATTYKRLLSDFFLPSPPGEDPIPHDFRRLPGEVAHRYSRALRYQLRLARERRELALDLAAELEAELPTLPPVRFALGADPEATGAELRGLLNVTFDVQRTWRTPRASYNAWRASIERAGILVFQVTGVRPAEMLGFSLCDRPLPVIGVNRKLPINGRTFTLLHECVHVLLDRSGICDIDESAQRPPEEQSPEIFCNAVAAAALVPREALLSHALIRGSLARPREWSEDELGSLGREFGVSNEVILRRLLTAGRTTQAFYAQRRAIWGHLFDTPETPSEPDTDFKRNMPQEVVSDLGRPFTRLVVESYLNSYTSLSDVSRYLGLRADKVAKVQELLAGEQ